MDVPPSTRLQNYELRVYQGLLRIYPDAMELYQVQITEHCFSKWNHGLVLSIMRDFKQHQPSGSAERQKRLQAVPRPASCDRTVDTFQGYTNSRQATPTCVELKRLPSRSEHVLLVPNPHLTATPHLLAYTTEGDGRSAAPGK